MELFILSPILFPLLGLLINASLGKRLGEKAVGWIASIAVIASFAVSLMMFAQLGAAPATEGGEHGAPGLHATILPWITAGALNVSWGFTVDQLSVTLMLIITGIAFTQAISDPKQVTLRWLRLDFATYFAGARPLHLLHRARPSCLPASRCRRSPRPTRSAPRRWPRSARSRRRRAG